VLLRWLIQRIDCSHEAVSFIHMSDIHSLTIIYSPPSDINPNCRKLYTRLCYLLMSQKKCERQFEDTIRRNLGSRKEQEATAREFGMVNHVFQLQSASGRFQEACELAVNVGLLEEALSLVEDRGVFLPELVLSTVVNYVHAGRLVHVSTKLEGNNVEEHYRTFQGGRTLLLEQTWISLMTYLNRYIQREEIPSAGDFPEDFQWEFFILLVCSHSHQGVLFLMYYYRRQRLLQRFRTVYRLK